MNETPSRNTLAVALENLLDAVKELQKGITIQSLNNLANAQDIAQNVVNQLSQDE